MKIAFDFGGVINETPELQELAKSLLIAGNEVFIISIAFETENREEMVRKLGIPFSGIFVVLEDGKINHGEEKLKIMKEIGCNIIFDDNVEVINVVRKAGMIGLHVFNPNVHNHKNKELRVMEI